jgi:hypothetical protein
MMQAEARVVCIHCGNVYTYIHFSPLVSVCHQPGCDGGPLDVWDLASPDHNCLANGQTEADVAAYFGGQVLAGKF